MVLLEVLEGAVVKLRGDGYVLGTDADDVAAFVDLKVRALVDMSDGGD
jgi:hypothetical protein